MQTPQRDGLQDRRLTPHAPSRRSVPSGLAAMAVVMVMVLVWWLFSGNGPQGPAGSESRFAGADQGAGPDNLSSDGAAGGSFDAVGGGSDPAQGAAPGSTGSAGAGMDDSAPGPAPDIAEPDGVRIDGYVLEGDRVLALNYVTGDPACVGTLATPRVVEDDAAVTVTLTLQAPESPPSGPCPELAMLGTVRVDLDSPLGERGVLDGAFDPKVLVGEASRPFDG